MRIRNGRAVVGGGARERCRNLSATDARGARRNTFQANLDDDASVRHSIVQLLESDGLKAQSFEDAEVFFAHARSHEVPLVLLDFWMPEMSGLQVQARLRELSPDTKVILMTGRETSAIRAAALEGGAFAFLVKPFDDEAFLSFVRQALCFVA